VKQVVIVGGGGGLGAAMSRSCWMTVQSCRGRQNPAVDQRIRHFYSIDATKLTGSLLSDDREDTATRSCRDFSRVSAAFGKTVLIRGDARQVFELNFWLVPHSCQSDRPALGRKRSTRKVVALLSIVARGRSPSRRTMQPARQRLPVPGVPALEYAHKHMSSCAFPGC